MGLKVDSLSLAASRKGGYDEEKYGYTYCSHGKAAFIQI